IVREFFEDDRVRLVIALESERQIVSFAADGDLLGAIKFRRDQVSADRLAALTQAHEGGGKIDVFRFGASEARKGGQAQAAGRAAICQAIDFSAALDGAADAGVVVPL